MTGQKTRCGMGWIPDYPDLRDYTEETTEVQQILAPAGLKKARAKEPAAPPATTDLRPWCSPVEDQGMLGSCTAHAGAGAIEYYASRLFLYKVTRNLMKMKGDTGAYLRTTMGAMVLFGVPPEEHWPYTDDEKKFDKEPPAFCYAFAQNYQTVKYFRHDPPGSKPETLLKRLKTHLCKGHPAMFGFTVYNSIEQAFPHPGRRSRGDMRSWPWDTMTR
jgi:C1A family cysteine protease